MLLGAAARRERTPEEGREAPVLDESKRRAAAPVQNLTPRRPRRRDPERGDGTEARPDQAG